jgi:hypothetical protein
MSYCLVTRSPKAYPEVRLLARECLRERRCLCRRGSYHRLFRCRRNPDCWGRWDRCRARPAPMLESRNSRSHTGRPAPRPACSGRLTVRRCYATRNRQRAPAPPLPASTLYFPSCGALYPTAHPGDTLTLDGTPSVASGQRKGAVNVCRMPSCRETLGTERRFLQRGRRAWKIRHAARSSRPSPTASTSRASLARTARSMGSPPAGSRRSPSSRSRSSSPSARTSTRTI